MKKLALWSKSDLLDYRERVFEKSRLRVSRAEKAVERAKKADSELAEARAEADRIEAGKAQWDALWPYLEEVETKMNESVGVSMDDAIFYKDQHVDLIHRMKKLARGAVFKEKE